MSKSSQAEILFTPIRAKLTPLSTFMMPKSLTKYFKIWSILILRIKSYVLRGISHGWIVTFEDGICLFKDFPKVGKLRDFTMSFLLMVRLFLRKSIEKVSLKSRKDLDGFNIKMRAQLWRLFRKWQVKLIKIWMEVLLFWQRSSTKVEKIALFMYQISL